MNDKVGEVKREEHEKGRGWRLRWIERQRKVGRDRLGIEFRKDMEISSKRRK